MTNEIKQIKDWLEVTPTTLVYTHREYLWTRRDWLLERGGFIAGLIVGSVAGLAFLYIFMTFVVHYQW